MNGLTRFFIAIVVACAVTGCAQPIGSIGGGESGSTGGDKLEAIPKKQHYNLTEVFIRDYDLAVFTVRRGILYYVPLDEVSIYVIEDRENPETSRVLIPLDPNEDKYMFHTIGHIGIQAVYKNLSDTYYVEVEDPFEIGGGGSDSGSGIEVEWGY